MRKFGIFVAILLLVGVVLTVNRPASGGEGWLTSHDDAVAQAEATGKPILVDFTGSDWCGWCIKLDKEVFSTSAFKEWAGENVILLVLDFPRSKSQSAKLKQQNQRLQQKYGVRGYPTILFLDEKGGVIGRSGYRRGGAEAWIVNAQNVIDQRPVDATKPRLMTSLDAAGRAAKTSQRPVLIVATDSADKAKAVKEGLFADGDFIKLTNTRLVAVHMDISDEDDEAKRFAKVVSKLHVDKESRVLLVSHNGKKLLMQATGDEETSKLLASLQESLPELSYDGEWTEDYERAKALAASLELPMLLDFSGSDWCPPCIKMEKDVFSEKAFHKYAAENLVLVLVDFPRRKPQSAQLKQRNQALAQTYGVQAYPTMIVVDAEGKELGRMVGYVAGGTTGFISKVKGFVAAAK